MSAGTFYASKGEEVTPDDSAPNVFDAIYVGGAGDVEVRLQNDVVGSIIFVAVPVGSILPIRTSLILATGTTATNIIGLNLVG